MDSEHIFSASIVLLMVCIAFPADSRNTHAMNMGLKLLRGMAERGNSYVWARYKLLDHLRSMVHHQHHASGSSKMPTVDPQESLVAPFTSSASTPLAASPPIYPGVGVAQSPFTSAAAAQASSGRNSSFSCASHRHLNPLGHIPPATPAIAVPNTGLEQRTLVFGPMPVANGSAVYCSQPSAAPVDDCNGVVDMSQMFGGAGFSPGSVGSSSNPYRDVPAAFGGSGVFSDTPGGFDDGGGGGGNGSVLFEPGLRLQDADAVEAMFFDIDMSNVTGADYRLWEASFVDPSAFDISQLTHAAEMAVERGGGMGDGEAAAAARRGGMGAAGGSGDAAGPVDRGMSLRMEL